MSRRSNATAVEPTEQGPAVGTSEGSERRRSKVKHLPGVIRLHPYTERFAWSARKDEAELVDQQIRAAATENKGDLQQTTRDLWRLARRVGPHPRQLNSQVAVLYKLQEAVSTILPNRLLVLVGPVSWDASVASAIPRLALKAVRGGSIPSTLADKTAELEQLIPSLKEAGLSVHCEKGILRAHLKPTENEDKSRLAQKISISHQTDDRLIANAIIGSYMALSPGRLVPLFRAVTAIPIKLQFCPPRDLDHSRAVMAICYLQSLPQELLPKLHQASLLREFGIKSNKVELPTKVAGGETARIDYTYLPIGLSDYTLDKIGFDQHDKETSFVRKWRNRPAPSLQELLSGFYYWYAGEVPARFDWAKDAVSVKGRRSRESFDPEGRFAKDAMVIIDPLNPNINLAAGFTHSKEVINEAFMESLRDELVSDPEVKLETLVAQRGTSQQSQTVERKAPPSLKRPAKRAAAVVVDKVLTTTGVESLEAAVPKETAPKIVKEDVKEEITEDVNEAKDEASSLIDQAKEFKEKVVGAAEEIKAQVVGKAGEVESQVEAKIDEVKKD